MERNVADLMATALAHIFGIPIIMFNGCVLDLQVYYPHSTAKGLEGQHIVAHERVRGHP